MGLGFAALSGGGGLVSTSHVNYRLIVRPGPAVVQSLEAEVCSAPGGKPQGFDPVIEIARFQVRDYLEDMLVHLLHRVLAVLEGFPVLINNYGGVPPHSIYLRIQDPSPFRNIIQQLSVADQFLRGDEGERMVFLPPMLVLYKGVLEKKYPPLLAHFARRLWHEVLDVDQLELCRSVPGSAVWQRIAVFGLKPAPVGQII